VSYLKNMLLNIGVIAVFGYLAIQLFFPTYSYRYRLIVAVQDNGKIHERSSVINVAYQSRGFLANIFGSAYWLNIHGQAVVIDLKDGGVLLTALDGRRLFNFESRSTATNFASLAYKPALRRVENSKRSKAVKLTRRTHLNEFRPSTLVELGITEPVNLGFERPPRFYWLSDRQDPDTAEPVQIDEFSNKIGSGIELEYIKVQLTNDPVVIDITEKLPWLKSLYAERTAKGRPNARGRETLDVYTLLKGHTP